MTQSTDFPLFNSYDNRCPLISNSNRWLKYCAARRQTTIRERKISKYSITDDILVSIVSDNEILAAITEVAHGAAVFGEPAGVASYAGLKRAVQQDRIDPDWTIVLLVTGSGLKDIAAATKVAGQPRAIPPDPEALAELF